MANYSRILIIGCVSRDLIHLEQLCQSFECTGGAGFYTALAARATGAPVTLVAPRPPDVHAIGVSLSCFDWIGPISEDLPQLEIRHHGNDRATLVGAAWGAESLLDVSQLPEDLDDYAIIHIAALSSAKRQLNFLHAVKSRHRCKISLGTYARLAYGETETVRELVKLSDLVFMNENEARAIFDDATFPLKSSGSQIVSITKGKNGAEIYTPDSVLRVPGLAVQELDPTGAGDTFAGTMIGCMAQNVELRQCVQLAIQRSSLVITEIGAGALSRIIPHTD